MEVALKWVRHLGAKLGRSWSQVGLGWAEVVYVIKGHNTIANKVSWAEVGALLAEADPKSGRCIWTFWADLQKVKITTKSHALFGDGARANMPPQLKLYQSDRSVRITRCQTTTPWQADLA